MTIFDKIHAAWIQNQLRQTPPKYLALLERLAGGLLNAEENLMCEELYLLDMVTRLTWKRTIPDLNNPNQTNTCPEIRYIRAADTPDKPCEECEQMKLRIRELEELLTTKTVTYRAIG